MKCNLTLTKIKGVSQRKDEISRQRKCPRQRSRGGNELNKLEEIKQRPLLLKCCLEQDGW